MGEARFVGHYGTSVAIADKALKEIDILFKVTSLGRGIYFLENNIGLARKQALLEATSANSTVLEAYITTDDSRVLDTTRSDSSGALVFREAREKFVEALKVQSIRLRLSQSRIDGMVFDRLYYEDGYRVVRANVYVSEDGNTAARFSPPNAVCLCVKDKQDIEMLRKSLLFDYAI